MPATPDPSECQTTCPSDSTCPLVSSHKDIGPLVAQIHKSHDEPAPSLHSHYRSFTTTTSRSAGEAASVLRAPGFRRRQPPYRPPGTPPPVPPLAFPVSGREPQTGLTPPPCRTPPGQ